MLEIRSLREEDLDEADRICRLAFGTFLGLPDPMAFMGDADYVRTRWRADPEAAFAAELDGRFVGSNFATRWGRFGFFGPLTVRPDLWDRGVARRLLDRTMECFEGSGTSALGLFTFAHSAKHVALYQKYGFWPRFLTAILSKPVAADAAPGDAVLVSEEGLEEGIGACREVAETLFPGLDPGREIASVNDQRLGDTVVLREDGRPVAFAIVHTGAGSEAGSGNAYVKLGAAAPGPAGARSFERLLDAVEAFAARQGCGTLVAGTNLAREAAYRILLARGFRVMIQGVAMHRPSEPGFSHPEAFVLDDWR